MILQHTKYSGVAWLDHWKKVSHCGYDVYNGRSVDLATSGLHPEARPTNHSVEMHGDVSEILMAALRAHPELQDVTPRPLPQMLEKLTLVCRTIHVLDVYIRMH